MTILVSLFGRPIFKINMFFETLGDFFYLFPSSWRTNNTAPHSPKGISDHAEFWASKRKPDSREV